jgi:limonene-1,2-epoxide hydrolase
MNRHRPLISRRAFGTGGLAAIAFGFARAGAAQVAPPFGASLPRDVERANIAVVDDFCAAFARKDVAKAVSLLSDGCSYRTSQTRPPIVGKENVASTITRFIELGAEFKVIRSVALGPLVLNERDDSVVMDAGAPARTFHIAAGLFFIADGRIAEWTDYVIR